MARAVERRLLPMLAMLASGFAGLGYQVIWTQQSALWLGHDSAAVLAVVAAFFAGLAFGARTLGARVERSARPLLWYAGCEWVIALWGCFLAFAMPPISARLLELSGADPSPLWQWLVAFGGTGSLLLPATAAMGATLPAMQRVARQLQGSGSVARLYAANTFGAVLGVLGIALWLIPTLGLRSSVLVCAGLNLLAGLSCWMLLRRSRELTPSSGPPPGTLDVTQARRLCWKLCGTGLLGIGYEVLVVRVLTQVTENTVYTFALLLAVYLVGSAAGAAGYERLAARGTKPETLEATLCSALSLACLVGTATLWSAERTKAWAIDAFGAGQGSALAAEAVPAILALALPTVLMGALFSHLARQVEQSSVGLGRGLALNTLGAALAPALFGVLLAPALGAKLALVLLSAGYLALIHRARRFSPGVWLAALGAVGLGALAPPLSFIDVPEGGRIVSYQEGVAAAVSVVEDAAGVARLRINNRAQEGSSVTQRVDGRQAWLPMLLHPAPKRALFLGLGTGVTAASAAEDPTLQVEAVELLPEVIAASTYFSSSVADGARARLHVVAADARRYVRASRSHYDVIVSDNFHPARSGSGSLYTVEHFQAVRARLEASGIFCQWLPLHQLDRATTRSIVRAFLAAFPGGWAMLASNSLETPVLGLVGRRDARRFDGQALQRRMLQLALPERIASIGLEDELALLGSFVAGPASLRNFAADAPLNTDDRPVVAYLAPRITYAPDSSPATRLLALLAELRIEPEALLENPLEPGWSKRLAAYWAARDRFIVTGRAVVPSPRVEDMLAQVQQPLLSVLRLSPDFRPAYDPLLAMSATLARTNPSAASALLAELAKLQPERTEAAQLASLVSAGNPGAGAARP